MLLVGHTRNKTAKASVGFDRSVSTSQVGQIRGARRFGNSRWQRQVDRAGDYKGLTDTAETYMQNTRRARSKSSWTTTMTTTGSTLSQ